MGDTTECAVCDNAAAQGWTGLRGSHCTGCHREWTGLREAHCAACHRHFSTPGNFDAHRRRDQCVDPATTLRPGCGWPVYRLREGAYGPTWVEGRHEDECETCRTEVGS